MRACLLPNWLLVIDGVDLLQGVKLKHILSLGQKAVILGSPE